MNGTLDVCAATAAEYRISPEARLRTVEAGGTG